MGKKLDRKIEKVRKELEKREARVSEVDHRLHELETKKKVRERFQKLPTAWINKAQADALAVYFNFDSARDDGELWSGGPMELTLYPGASSEDGCTIVLNGTFLRKDGEWATFAPGGDINAA